MGQTQLSALVQPTALVPSYMDFLGSQGIDTNTYQSYTPEVRTALENSYTNLKNTPTFGADVNMANANQGINSSFNTADTKGTDWGMSGYGGVALGAGNLALGLASYFDNKDIAKKQKELLSQQIQNNSIVMANSAANKAARKSAFENKVI